MFILLDIVISYGVDMKQLLFNQFKVFIVAVLLLFSFVFLTISTNMSQTMRMDVVFSFILNGFLILILLINELNQRSASCVSMHYLFVYVFLFIAPVIQISSKYSVWGISYTQDEVFYTNIVICLWIVFFKIGTFIVKNKCWTLNIKSFEWNIKVKYVRMAAILLFLITLYFIGHQGFVNLIGTGGYIYSDSGSPVGMIINCSVIALFTFVTVLSIKLYQNTHAHFALMLMCLLCLMISYFPTALSRYSAAAIYLCVFLNLFPTWLKGQRFFILMILGLLLVFPVLDLFRYTSILDIQGKSIVQMLTNLKSYFTTGNYDSYQMVLASTKYTNYFGITYGKQLLGVFLFFIPRTLWPNKPVSTGTEIANQLDLQYSNISSPLPAEGMVNFGILGVILFALFFGVIMKKLDNTYYNYLDRVSWINVIYLYLMPFTVFLSRGSLLSAFAYLIANCVVSWMLVRLHIKSVL